MQHLDLFSGIGGFALAASWVWGKEHEIVSFVEIDSFCQKVLKKHWPDVPIISDIRELNIETVLADTTKSDAGGGKEVEKGKEPINRKSPQLLSDTGGGSGRSKAGDNHGRGPETIDLLTGGFPCQPYSVAGKQGGASDDRALFPELLRVIQEVRPTWIILENVPGIIKMGLNSMLSDLENSGYWNYRDKQGRKRIAPIIAAACGQDAPHRRDRVWIVAHRNNSRSGIRLRTDKDGQAQNKRRQGQPQFKPCENGQDVAYTKKQLGNGGNNNKRSRSKQIPKSGNSNKKNESRINRWLPEPNVGRVAHGVPDRVDRLKCLGNAIVPQVVVPIMEAIKQIESN